MSRNDPNKVLRVSADATVNARDYRQVLCDTSGNAIALTLISPSGTSEWSIKIKNTGSAGNDVTITVAGGYTIDGGSDYPLTDGAGVIIEQDDLGQLWAFASAGGAGGSGFIIPPDQSITYSGTPYAGTGSFQPIGPDLNIDAAAGSSTDPKYIADAMFNVIGDALTKTKTYIAAVIAKLSITGTDLSTYPRAAIAAEIGDGVTAADGAVVAVLGGDSAQTNARAAFTVDNQNSTPASGFDYGLDLQGPGAHDGYPVVSYLQGDIRFSDGTTQSTAAGSGSYEVPVGAVNGINAAFTFSLPPVLIFRNGVMERRLGTIVGNVFTFDTPPDIDDNIEGLI